MPQESLHAGHCYTTSSFRKTPPNLSSVHTERGAVRIRARVFPRRTLWDSVQISDVIFLPELMQINKSSVHGVSRRAGLI